MSASTVDEEVNYVPGQGKRKLFMILVGIIIVLYGLSQMWVPLRLLISGVRTTAEVTRVIKAKSGLPDQFFSDDLHLNAALEREDRTYIYWNEFHFTSLDGMDHVIRFDVGSELRPLCPLLDDDGLPTHVLCYYDPKKTNSICIPTVLSTWFAPFMLVFMGLCCIFFGIVLFSWSDTKIPIS